MKLKALVIIPPAVMKSKGHDDVELTEDGVQLMNFLGEWARARWPWITQIDGVVGHNMFGPTTAHYQVAGIVAKIDMAPVIEISGCLVEGGFTAEENASLATGIIETRSGLNVINKQVDGFCEGLSEVLQSMTGEAIIICDHSVANSDEEDSYYSPLKPGSATLIEICNDGYIHIVDVMSIDDDYLEQ